MKHLKTFESFDYINEGLDVSSLLQKLGTIKDKVYNEIKSKGYLEKLQTVLAPFKDCKSVEEVQAKAKELTNQAKPTTENYQLNESWDKVKSVIYNISQGGMVGAGLATIISTIAWAATQGAPTAVAAAIISGGAWVAALIFWITTSFLGWGK